MYGIWCKDTASHRHNVEDWYRCPECECVCAFETKAKAFRRAAEIYGYDSYSKMKKDGWCEVRKLS